MLSSQPTPPPWTTTTDLDASHADLLGLFTPSSMGDDRFVVDVSRVEGHLFGGIVAAQSLHAAYATVDEGRRIQSVHGYFLRPGRPEGLIELEVQRDTDGRSFSARRIAAVQEGRPIFTMVCSFHVPEDGPVLSRPVPVDRSQPPGAADELESDLGGLLQLRRDVVRGDDHVDHRVGTSIWFRVAAPLPDDDVLRDCLLLYVSDYGTPWHAAAPAGVEVGPSLDHSVWFRRRTDLEQWHHIHHEPIALSDARGLYLGHIWRADGAHVATIAQENLIRPSPG